MSFDEVAGLSADDYINYRRTMIREQRWQDQLRMMREQDEYQRQKREFEKQMMQVRRPFYP